MNKTVLLTGSTDGIGLETAKKLVSRGHVVLLHGRNHRKLEGVCSALSGGDGTIVPLTADLSRMSDINTLAGRVLTSVDRVDVLINNAGVFKTATPVTADGLDVRFVVNTIAPYLLTKRLLPLLDPSARVVNVSSAAQAPVDTVAMTGQRKLSDSEAYAQSKLALTMWSRDMAETQENGPIVVAVNPASLLGSKMVRDAYGIAGGDVGIGADILVRAAFSDEFSTANGLYFDNDSGRFADPHPDALDAGKCRTIVTTIENVLNRLSLDDR